MPTEKMTKTRPPIWVLNLESSTQRREFMTGQLRTLGVEYEIIKAVDKKKLTPADFEKSAKAEDVRALSSGEIACALSHAKMWERIVDDAIDEVLVLEDDIHIGEAFLKILDARFHYPDDWEFINYATKVRSTPVGELICGNYRATKFKKYANRTSAYLVNQQGARKLLANAYPIRYAADGLTGRTYITNLISYGIRPRVVALTDFASDIWN